MDLEIKFMSDLIIVIYYKLSLIERKTKITKLFLILKLI